MLVDRQMVMSYIIGDWGEILAADALRDKGFKVVRNLYIWIDGKETEIDIVAISEYGIYVIEVKNYNAKVEGRIKDKYWLCSYSYSETEEFLFNPYMQNKKHVEAIKSLLDNIRAPFYNIVLFGEKTNLVIKDFNGWVFTQKEFIDKYENITLKKKKKCLTKSQIDEIYEKLLTYSDSSFEKRCEFVSGIEEMRNGAVNRIFKQYS